MAGKILKDPTVVKAIVFEYRSLAWRFLTNEMYVLTVWLAMNTETMMQTG